MSRPQTLHRRACKLLGVDPEKLRLIGPSEWKDLHGLTVSTALGIASRKHPVVYVRRSQGYDTYVHEVLHHLFPSRPHWWIFEASWKLSGVSAGHRYGYGHAYLARSGGHKIESRTRLLRLAAASAEKRSLS